MVCWPISRNGCCHAGGTGQFLGVRSRCGSRIVPAYDATLVKAFIRSKDDPTIGEFCFIDDVLIGKTHVLGSFNGFSTVLGLEMGEPVQVPVEDVCDWLIASDGMIHKGGIGGFTVDVLKKTIPAGKRAEYEAHPPVSWYRHRNKLGITAQDELNQVPVCKDCGQRSLIDYGYKDGRCVICISGIQRVDCEKCGVPLLRYDNDPKTCKGCMRDGKKPSGWLMYTSQLQAQFAQMRSGAAGEGEAVDEDANEDSPPGMSAPGKIYTGLTMLITAGVAVIFGMMLFDPAGGQAKGRPMMLSIGGGLLIVLVGTLIWNIRKKRLMPVATILQALALLLTCLGVPVAVFGIVAMSQQPKRHDH
jgi:uncharacterized protein YegJ (DUF2314 family)